MTLDAAGALPSAKQLPLVKRLAEQMADGCSCLERSDSARRRCRGAPAPAHPRRGAGRGPVPVRPRRGVLHGRARCRTWA